MIMFRRMKLKKELRAVKEINEQERKKREDGRNDGEFANHTAMRVSLLIMKE
jgi:Homeobox protein